MTAVRVVNGATLPARGVYVAAGAAPASPLTPAIAMATIAADAPRLVKNFVVLRTLSPIVSRSLLGPD
jgi:hypothetical protein